jgi:hypothetical protein
MQQSTLQLMAIEYCTRFHGFTAKHPRAWVGGEPARGATATEQDVCVEFRCAQHWGEAAAVQQFRCAAFCCVRLLFPTVSRPQTPYRIICAVSLTSPECVLRAVSRTLEYASTPPLETKPIGRATIHTCRISS